MNKNGKTDSYDVTVKYQNVDTSEAISFEDFWQNEEILSINPENLTLTIAEANGVGSDKEYVFNNYKGYVKFTGWWNDPTYSKIFVDGIELP